jgi:hypothetical protein
VVIYWILVLKLLLLFHQSRSWSKFSASCDSFTFFLAVFGFEDLESTVPCMYLLNPCCCILARTFVRTCTGRLDWMPLNVLSSKVHESRGLIMTLALCTPPFV